MARLRCRVSGAGRRWAVVVLGAGPALVSGCDLPEPGPSAFAARDAVDLDEGAADAGRADAGADAGLTLDDPRGTWVLFAEDRKCLSAVGTSVENLIWTWYRVEVLEAPAVAGGGRTLRARVELCAQELSPFIGGLRTIVPPAIPAAVPPRDWTAFLLGSAPGDPFLGGELTELWGAAGLEPEEALPADANDARLVDLDEDGRPGVSFAVGSDGGGAVCEVFVVQRTRLRLEGAVVDARRIEGTFWSLVDKTILGSTAALCAPENVMVQSPNANQFKMLRVDGREGALALDLDRDGRVACAELLDARAVLASEGGLTLSAPESAVCR